jgi:hypothetical protein
MDLEAFKMSSKDDNERYLTETSATTGRSLLILWRRCMGIEPTEPTFR